MPFPDFFRQFGIYSALDFFELELCMRLCREMDAAESEPGTVWSVGKGVFRDESLVKRSETANIPDELLSVIDEKLLSLKPDIESAFDVKLNGFQPPKLTRYDVGDFFAKHLDTIGHHPDAPAPTHERKVSVIISLNQEGETPDEADYCGGNLTFYGLMGDAEWLNIGLPLESEAGMLTAFRPSTFHEVTPVTHGSRYTITTWYI